MPRALLALIGLLACLHIQAVPSTQPITYREEVRHDPPLHLHIVQIDLTDPRISLHAVRAGEKDPDGAGPWHVTLAPTSIVARRENFAVAVNANYFIVKEAREILGHRIPYFNGNWAQVSGWAVSNGEKVSLDRGYASLIVRQSGETTIEFHPLLPSDSKEVVSGVPMLVRDGKYGPDVPKSDNSTAPRTGIGLDVDRKTLTIIVVDGRREDYSAGLSVKQFANEFMRLGCHNAMNLDGGGSSTLVMKDSGGRTWSVRNRPSDGHGLWGDPSIERSVAFVLGVRFDDRK